MKMYFWARIGVIGDVLVYPNRLLHPWQDMRDRWEIFGQGVALLLRTKPLTITVAQLSKRPVRGWEIGRYSS